MCWSHCRHAQWLPRLRSVWVDPLEELPEPVKSVKHGSEVIGQNAKRGSCPRAHEPPVEPGHCLGTRTVPRGGSVRPAPSPPAQAGPPRTWGSGSGPQEGPETLHGGISASASHIQASTGAWDMLAQHSSIPLNPPLTPPVLCVARAGDRDVLGLRGIKAQQPQVAAALFLSCHLQEGCGEHSCTSQLCWL